MASADKARQPTGVVPPPTWFLAFCAAIAPVGLTILTPTLPLIRQDLGVSSTSVQQLFTAYLFTLAAGQLVFGPISDRIGRRPLLLLGALLFSISSFAVLATSSIQILVMLRVVQGIGAAACMAMGRAMINDCFEREEAARQMSTIAIVLAIAPALSIAFGGFIAESFGWRGTMILLGVAGFAVFLAGFTYASETHLHRLTSINARSIAHAYRQVLSDRVFLCWTMCSGMQIGIFFSLNAFLGYQFVRNGYSLTEFGIWFSLTPLSYLIGNAFNRSWFVKRGIELASMTGCTLSLLSVCLLFLTQKLGYTHALSLALPCCLFGFSNGIVVANATMGAISVSGKHAGTGTGIVGSWQMATGGIAGAVIAVLGGAQIFDITAAVLIFMGVISVSSMLYVFRNRRLVPT